MNHSLLSRSTPKQYGESSEHDNQSDILRDGSPASLSQQQHPDDDDDESADSSSIHADPLDFKQVAGRGVGSKA